MTNRSSVLAASFAILIASPGTAQPEPFSYSDACSTLHVRGDEAVLLSRLCADSFYEAREVAAADAACGAASERFEEVASATTELSVEGKLDECLAVQTREEQLRILRWVLAYTDYRISGHIPPPNPRIGKSDGRTGALIGN